jgi:tetratricopeptide (TPR) repeat protein
MARERRSLQDLIRSRQQKGFVGRQQQVVQFQENLGFLLDDERRRFIFNIYGDAGVGKTYLTKQLRKIAIDNGCLTAYIDETVDDATSAMTVIAEEFSRGGVRLGDFEKRAAAYQERRHELEADPQTPDGVATFLTKTAVTIGLAAARDVPIAGSLLAPVDAAATADQINRARTYLARKFRDHADVRLLLSPADELSPVFVSDMDRAALSRPVALFIDTYERTSPLLDQWLRRLYCGQYGDLPDTLIITISGQKPLDTNLWGEYLPVIADVPLEPFSDAEARQFLASKNIHDESTIQVILTLSGRLPMWLATLAESRPANAADIGDPAGDAVERFLKWEDDPAKRSIAMTAALPRMLNQDILAAIAPADKVRDLFGWLCGLPFVTRRAGSWAYHEVVRAAMLRLQLAQAPSEWRSNQATLAQSNRRWACDAADGTDEAWTNPNWIDRTREEIYHLLCADPINNLPKALASAVKAAGYGAIRARQWAEVIADAGRDAGHETLRQLGQQLFGGINDNDLTLYLTYLINDGHLDKSVLAVALEERGESHRSAKRHEEAIADFTRAVELDPSNARAFGNRGATYGRMERYEEGIADFTRAVELDPSRAWVIGSRGVTYGRMERYEEAIADFTRAVELDPSRAWVIGSRGATYGRMERYKEAIADYTRVIELDPSNIWAIISRGATYRQMECYEEAIADFTRVIELDPSNAWVIGIRGGTYRRVERYEEAIADYSRAIELDPSDTLVIGSRGGTYRRMERYEEAIADYTHAIELDPSDTWAIGSRGAIYGRMERYEEAIADYTRAIELDPNNPRAIGNRGQTYQKMKRYEEAIADYTRVIELDPSDTWAIISRGATYGRMERYEEAIADYTRAIELDPSRAWVIRSRGATYGRMERYEEAIADYTHAIELDPNNARAIISRGATYRQMERYDEAIADFNHAIELDPNYRLPEA